MARGDLGKIKKMLAQPGAKIQLVRHDFLGDRVKPSMLEVRSVKLLQTNGVQFSNESWLWWPPAGQVRLTMEGFEVCLSEDGTFNKSMEYAWR